MTSKHVSCLFLFLVAVALRLPGQPSESDRKFFADTKANAEKGDASAQNNLGVCCANGQGVAKDYVEAVKWYRKAAHQNLADAQNNLGGCYDKGHGVVEDAVEAVQWFRKAAERDFAGAQNNLGVCYATGKGVRTNYVEAMKWFRKAADQNFADGQNSLGFCYATGQGVAKDYVEGCKWWRLAAAQGDEAAGHYLSTLERQMAQEQIANGKRRANDWLEQHKKSAANSR